MIVMTDGYRAVNLARADEVTILIDDKRLIARYYSGDEGSYDLTLAKSDDFKKLAGLAEFIIKAWGGGQTFLDIRNKV